MRVCFGELRKVEYIISRKTLSFLDLRVAPYGQNFLPIYITSCTLGFLSVSTTGVTTNRMMEGAGSTVVFSYFFPSKGGQSETICGKQTLAENCLDGIGQAFGTYQ